MQPLNNLIRTIAPADPLISLEEARLQCRVDTWGSPPVNPEDSLIMQYVQAATDELDGVDGWLNRALVTQTWQLRLCSFVDTRIKLPLPPLQSVTSITYTATDGDTVTMDPSDYTVTTDADPGSVRPVSGSWPSVAADGEVLITYVAGYGDPEDVPELIRQYVRLRTAQYYDQRELARNQAANPGPFMRDSLESLRMRGVYP